VRPSILDEEAPPLALPEIYLVLLVMSTVLCEFGGAAA
jgi:hypothetical protein